MINKGTPEGNNIMNLLGNTIRNKRTAVLTTCTAIFILLLLALGLNDDTIDDFLIQLNFLPLNGKASAYHQWITVYWARVVFWLQSQFPSYAWHYLLSCILILASTNGIVFWICEKNNISFQKQLLIGVTVTILVYSQTIHSMNFTRTAGLIMATGILYLMSGRKRDIIVGFFFLLSGAMIRFACIYIFAGFVCVVFLCRLIQKTDNTKHIFYSAVLVLTAFAVCAGIHYSSRLIVKTNDKWRELREYNNVAASVYDYKMVDYDANEELYHSIGLSKNDYELIGTRMSNSDPDYYTTDKYRKIANTVIQRKEKTGFRDVCSIAWSQFAEFVRQNNLARAGMSLLLLSAFAIDRRNKWIPMIIMGMIFLYFLFFSWYGRMMVRVEVSIIWGAMVAFLLTFREIDYSDLVTRTATWKKTGKRVLCFLTGIIFVSCVAFPISNYYPRRIDLKKEEQFLYTEKDTGHFYEYLSGSYREDTAVRNLLLTDDYFCTKNMHLMTQFPISDQNYSKLDSYGIKNLFIDCIDSEVIRIVGGEESCRIFLNYLREHYCSSAEMVLIDDIYYGIGIFKVVSEQDMFTE